MGCRVSTTEPVTFNELRSCRGRPTKAGSYASNLAYAPNGALAGLDYGNGVSAAYGHDNTRQLLDSTIYSGVNGPFTDRNLTYDENANLKTITDSIGCNGSDVIFCDGFDGAVGTDAQNFVYDTLDRLTTQHSGRYGDDVYGYDPLGNVRSRTNHDGTVNFHYDSITNRISDVNGQVYGHDTRGNVTSVGTFNVDRNRANELISDHYGTTYAYDARGWRVKQVVSTGGAHTRYFVYDSQHRLMVRWDNGTETDFVYVGSKPIARIEGNSTSYIHDNYQHSPLFETDSTGTVTRTPDFWGYGQPVNADGLNQIPGYTGAAIDSETGLLYLGARYLSAPRFLSPDPAGLDPTSPVGLNRYAYANDNPVRFVDPEGMEGAAPCNTDCMKMRRASDSFNLRGDDSGGFSSDGAPSVTIVVRSSDLVTLGRMERECASI